MKHYVLAAATLLAAATVQAQQVKFPAASPQQTIRQEFGQSFIELTYARPSAKGRTMLGNIERFGEVWRMGANAATRIRFGSPVTLGAGCKVDTGQYVLYAIPTAKDWTIIVNRGLKNWGTDGYKQEEDVCRFTVPARQTATSTETMAFQFENIRPDRADLVVRWERFEVMVPIQTNVLDPLRQQVAANLASDKPNYWAATQFYNEYEKDRSKALEMVNKAIEGMEKQGQKPYWMHLYKARLLKDMGRKADAMAAANTSIELARAAKNMGYVRQNEELLKELR